VLPERSLAFFTKNVKKIAYYIAHTPILQVSYVIVKYSFLKRTP